MNDDVEEILPEGAQLEMLGELAEELTQRLESGEPVKTVECPTGADPIHQILPTLKTMVSLGEQLVREKRSNSPSQRKKRKSS